MRRILLLAVCLGLATLAAAPVAEAHYERCRIFDMVCFAECQVRHTEEPFAEPHGCFFMG